MLLAAQVTVILHAALEELIATIVKLFCVGAQLADLLL